MKKILAVLLIMSMGATPALAIETLAKHAYLVDATTGAVLLDKDGDTPMVPSSMSKLMTAYLVFERLKEGRLKLDDTFTVSEKAWRMQGSKTFVKIGDAVSVENLIHGVIVQSGNDACIVLAEGLTGSEEAFVTAMNEKAKELGLNNSHFVNATGWPDEGHVMSARDLSVLARRIISDFPDYYPYYGMREYTFNNITQHNRNRLLGNDIGVDGLKTGHTEAGGYGITLSAKTGDRRLILVINGLASDNERMKEGDNLLRWGFREFENQKLVEAGKVVAEADVWFGKSKTVPLAAKDDVVVTLPAGAKTNVSYSLRYQSPVPAPIAKGAHVADLVVKSDATEQVIPLVALNDVEQLAGIGKAIAIARHWVGL